LIWLFGHSTGCVLEKEEAQMDGVVKKMSTPTKIY
jgi:hypothetical protein